MEFLEREIEDLIYGEIIKGNFITIRGKGLYFINESYNYFRQPDLANYGRPDILGVSVYMHNQHINVDIQIIELKSKDVNSNTLLQAMRYSVGVQEMFQFMFGDQIMINTPEIHIIGTSVDFMSDFSYLNKCLLNAHYHILSFDFNNGVQVETPDMYLKNPGFNVDSNFTSKLKTTLEHDISRIMERMAGLPEGN